MSTISNIKNFNNENYAIFVNELNDVEVAISGLASYDQTNLKNLTHRLSCLNQTIPDQNSMELSTKIMSLAYILDEKVSQSYLPDETIKRFSVKLQKRVQSLYCKLPVELIRLIASYLPVKELVAFAQVDRRTYIALQAQKTPLLKNILETKVQWLRVQIGELENKAKEQFSNTIYSLQLGGYETFFEIADFDSAERLSIKHEKLRQYLTSTINSNIQSHYQLLNSKETKQSELAVVTSHFSEFPENPVKFQIGYVTLLKQIHNLSEKDTVKPEDVKEICLQLQNVQKYFTSNPAIELEFGYLYNHLVYALERKFEKLALQVDEDDLLEQIKQIAPKNQLSNFPHNVLYLIFENLDLQDQVALRSVCKQFMTVIDSKIANTPPFLAKKVMHLNSHEKNLNWKYERAQFLLKNLYKPNSGPFSQLWKEYVEKSVALNEEIKDINERLKIISTHRWEMNRAERTSF